MSNPSSSPLHGTSHTTSMPSPALFKLTLIIALRVFSGWQATL